MRLPSKITSYNESVISKFPPILTVLQDVDTGVFDLYKVTMNLFSSIEEFLDTLDCLFALQKVSYNEDCEVLCYVKRDLL